MNSEDERWLDGISTHIKNHPNLAPYVARYAYIGLESALNEMRQQLADVETIALAACEKKFKDADTLIEQMLKRLEGKLMFNWDWFFKRNRKNTRPTVETP